MVLNSPIPLDSNKIDKMFGELVKELSKISGKKIEQSDLLFKFFEREEYLGVLAEKIFPNNELPEKFGVYRGYNGGGIHSKLEHSKYYKIETKNLMNAQKCMALIEKTFNAVLEAGDDPEGEPWESCKL